MFLDELRAPERGPYRPRLQPRSRPHGSPAFRLKRVQGHVGSVASLVENGQNYGVDGPPQLRAVQGPWAGSMRWSFHTSGTVLPLPFRVATLRLPSTNP